MRLPKEIDLLAKSLALEVSGTKLLQQAVTHSSSVNEAQGETESNERLEFLGDAVLQLAISQFLFSSYYHASEGDLSRRRAQLVCESSLAQAAREISLGDYLILGRGEELSGGREKPSILADAFEALLGAIFLDKGWEAARSFVLKTLPQGLEGESSSSDFKTRLQELVQAQSTSSVRYVLLGEFGPAHDKTYQIGVRIGRRLYGQGEGKSKKEAEQAAAREALSRLKQEDLSDLSG
ncbi:MAG: ribonuclease III [Firmicutes bacterium]|nr:ribonuclease III [Bacillota bacterium]MCL5038331.1 ribonuclease III [Bacillota bacterium]